MLAYLSRLLHKRKRWGWIGGRGKKRKKRREGGEEKGKEKGREGKGEVKGGERSRGERRGGIALRNLLSEAMESGRFLDSEISQRAQHPFPHPHDR